MRRIRFAAVLGLVMAFGPVAGAQELRYWGREAQDPGKGWIELDGRYYQVGLGTMIAAWGTVTEITDTHLVTEHVLTEVEKERLRERGAAVYDVLQVRIPHEHLRQGLLVR